MLLRARHLVPISGPPVEDGAVVVRGEFVEAAGPWADLGSGFTDEEIVDLGDVTLLPGFVNAHCHLDYSTLRHAILPPTSFAEWVGRINALKRTMEPDDYLAAIARGFREFGRWGATTLLNVESFPELMWKMPPPPLRTWWFYELIDVRRVVPTEEIVAGALLFFQEAGAGTREPGIQGSKEGSKTKVQGAGAAFSAEGGWLGGTGLSPHAPYTASPELYRLARDCARHAGMPWTTHLGESRDERAMFVHGQGPLHAFLVGIGRPMNDCGHGRSALGQLTAAGCLGPECIAVHLNDWEEADFALVEPGGALAGMSVVHCPLSHRYFQHPRFPLERLRALEINLCVGTDSAASEGSFSLLDELRAAAAVYPGIEAREWLETITLNPARALGLAGKLGCIRPGAWADLIALPCGDGADGAGKIHAQILSCRQPTVWQMVNGRVTNPGLL